MKRQQTSPNVTRGTVIQGGGGGGGEGGLLRLEPPSLGQI